MPKPDEAPNEALPQGFEHTVLLHDTQAPVHSRQEDWPSGRLQPEQNLPPSQEPRFDTGLK